MSLAVDFLISNQKSTTNNSSVSWDDGRLDIASTVQHVAEDLLQARQGRLTGDVVGRTDLLGGNQSEGPADGFRRMVERGFQGDFGVVQAIRLELHLGSAGASAEEVDGSALADHVDSPLPGFRLAYGFNNDIAAALLRGERADGIHNVRRLGSLNDFVGAHLAGSFDLSIAFHDRDNVAADGPGDLNEHQPDRPAAEDGDRVADLNSRFVQAAKHACEGLSHRSIFKADVRRNDQHIRFNNAARHTNVLRIGAVVEQKIFAEVFLVLRAVEAHLAGRGVEGYDAHALLKAVDVSPNLLDDSREFVAEERGRHDHARVIAALVHLEIGAASQGDLNFDENLTIADARDGYFFDLEVFFAVQDGGGHFSVHS